MHKGTWVKGVAAAMVVSRDMAACLLEAVAKVAEAWHGWQKAKQKL